MDKIVLVGAGGHCKSCIDVIEQENKYQIVGITDKQSKPGEKMLGYPILGGDELLGEIRKEVTYALVTVGQLENATLRQALFNNLVSLNFVLPACISPRAYVARSASIGQGSIVMHDALLNSKAKVGNNVIINSKALVEHDAIIKDHCHISTGAIINGGVIINEASFIGSGAVLVQYTEVKRGAFIKANTLYKG